MKASSTREVLVFGTERKNNVDPCLRSQNALANKLGSDVLQNQVKF